jgi:D-Tyr-tRNAtyr deacylase
VRALVQRVTEARVRIAGSVVGEIRTGLCVLVGVTHDDDDGVARNSPTRCGTCACSPTTKER